MRTNSDLDQHIAAIDLGSNSFHMVIAQENQRGNIKIIDQVREMVRLGAGLDSQGNLVEDAQESALACLGRFKQRLVDIPIHRIRAVGTNTLRAAKNSDGFLRLAEQALGHPISVVSGHEEARLVYLGAAFDLAGNGKQRLVIDIGGGSTELIIGRGYRPMKMDSLDMGCVSITRRFFPSNKITEKRIENAEKLVLRELEPVLSEYRQQGWEEVVGTSGTIKAIDQLSRDLGLKQDWVSMQSIEAITSWLIACASIKKLSHISEQRRPVFIGGFIIFATIFRQFQIARIDISHGALREGVVYDLIDRLHNEDSRFLGVDSLCAQFKPDSRQSARVQHLALMFYAQTCDSWNLDENIHRKLLIWASQLHEIGISIAYNHHHLHGAYVIENSDLDGFSRQNQRVLALLVRNHRQKLDVEQMQWLPNEWPKNVMHLTIILRLAVAFYRGRADADLSHIKIKPGKNSLKLFINKSWANSHPLTIFDLETEKAYLSSAGYKISMEIK